MSRARQNKDKAAVFRTEKRQDSKESASMAGQNESSEVNSTIYDDNNSKPTFLSEMELVSVRDWFNNLSAIARAEAMGFVDCHFLNTLHRLLTSRTLSQPPTSEAIEANPENSGKLELSMSIAVEDIKAVFESLANKPVVEDSTNGSSIDIPNNLQKQNFAEILVPEPTKHLALSRAEDLSVVKSPIESESFPQNTFSWEHCSCIFPSIFIAAQRNMSSSYPFVTVDSKFLENEHLNDTLLCFDSMAMECFGSEFLSFGLSNSAPDSNTFILRLDTCKGGARIPVFAVLIARFEQAVYRSYSKFLEQTMSNTNDLVAEYSLRIEEQSVDKKCTTESHLNSPGFLKDIYSLVQEITAVSSVLDTDSVSFCMEPFLDAFKLTEKSGDAQHNDSKHLVFTQLSEVMTSAQETETIDFLRLDTAIRDSIQRIRSSGLEREPRMTDIINPSAPLSDEANANLESTSAIGRIVSDSTLEICTSTVAAVHDAHDVSESHGNLLLEFPSESSGPVDMQSSSQIKSRKKKKKSKKRKTRKGSTSLKDQNSLFTEVALNDDTQNDIETNNKPEIQDNATPAVDDHMISVSATPVVDDHVISATAAASFDSADSELSDKFSMKSDTSAARDSLERQGTNDSITISRFDGRIIVANPVVEIAPTTDVNGKDKASALPAAGSSEHDDEDPWETVEVKNKTSRKKIPDRSAQSNNRHGHHSFSLPHVSTESQLANKKSKNTRAGVSRRRNTNRKMVREILFSVIDNIDEESQKLKIANPIPSRSAELPKPTSNPWKIGLPGGRSALPVPKDSSIPLESPRREKTLRDVVLGIHVDAPIKKVASSKTVESDRIATVNASTSKNNSTKKDITPAVKNTQISKGKIQAAPNNDQNTAPTYQETVSAVSTVSNAALCSNEVSPRPKNKALKSDSSSSETDEAPPKLPAKLGTNVPPTPPLPTLLNPEIANSTTSSVASSLEAPHVVHSHHHSKSTQRTTDVGYHLLDVCDRLSRDMDLFMSRRAIALNPRRRERGALLAALQESVSSLWPGRCHVELYGSCAIQLDLPSSDLDVVVVGLDRNIDMLINQNLTMQSGSRGKSVGTDSVATSMSQDDISVSEDIHSHLPSMNPYILMPGVLNGDRVVRLAGEVETQPWAVQVKAIPTASVPVIKILADPSRISPNSNGLDWIPQQQFDAQHPEVIDKATEHGIANYAGQGLNQPATFLPWRGSDIVKGLLALDITFEGPEHGGIGSTEFSSRVIAETCHELGLYPEATPFVQVLLVLKELLAQRKLNEPYSGGLSSYALLLLVLALVRERVVIKNEIERVERQRKAMSSVGATSFANFDHGVADSFRSINSSETYETRHLQRNENLSGRFDNRHDQKNEKLEKSSLDATGKTDVTKPQTKSQIRTPSAGGNMNAQPRSGSWANVAKKGVISQNPPKLNHQNPQPSIKAQQGKKIVESKQKPSFADAVANTKSLHVSADRIVSAANGEKPKTTVNKIEKDKKIKNDEIVGSTIDVASTSGAQYSKDQTTVSLTPGKPIPEFIPESEKSTLLEPAFYPQGVNDIIEVLCSGETTAGQLLMHFFLFYGQHFDAQLTAIDISGKHVRDSSLPYSQQKFSPFIQRKSPGSIDPVTGMLIVDPIIVYDPLEGAENNNVARRCFCWNSVRWIFSQSYATLSSAVERSATPPTSPNGKIVKPGNGPSCDTREKEPQSVLNNQEVLMDPRDPSSPLLSCLLSF